VDSLVAALADQQGELAKLLEELPDGRWAAPTRCPGWDVADVVLHLAQTNEMAIASTAGRFAEVTARLQAGLGPAVSVDDGAARMVAAQRGRPPAEVRARWAVGATGLVDALASLAPSTRLPWVAGELSARTLATTRLAETWIHAGDVAGALGLELPPSDRLGPIARLAWRTLPYAFASAGRSLAGPVDFHLTSPSGERWDFVAEGALSSVSGPAAELCAVAARRVDGAATSLVTSGPDGPAVLNLVRTYA